jgi:NAD(P)-dependent dehydrogenase (short-subunit alcohol dehydrogenase family)
MPGRLAGKVALITGASRGIGAAVAPRFAREGAHIVPAARTVGLRARAGRQEIAIEADLVVHAAGRAPDLDALNLWAAGVAVENGRLVLREFLQSVSNPAVR